MKSWHLLLYLSFNFWSSKQTFTDILHNIALGQRGYNTRKKPTFFTMKESILLRDLRSIEYFHRIRLILLTRSDLLYTWIMLFSCMKLFRIKKKLWGFLRSKFKRLSMILKSGIRKSSNRSNIRSDWYKKISIFGKKRLTQTLRRKIDIF